MKLNNLTLNGQIKMYQQDDILKYTTDTILLAHFTKIKHKHNRIIELCAGTGAISLLLAHNYPSINIKAVEIQHKVADLLKKNVELNKFNKKITILKKDLKNIHKYLGQQSADVIVCNPPYFNKEQNIMSSKDHKIKIANFEIATTLNDIMKEAYKLLENKGYLYLVHRPERLSDIFQTAAKNKLVIKKIQPIFTQKNSPKANAILVSLRKENQNSVVEILQPIYTQNQDGKISEEMLKILKELE